MEEVASMDDEDKLDRIGAKLVRALERCIDEMNMDNLCLLLAQAFRLLDRQRLEEGDD